MIQIRSITYNMPNNIEKEILLKIKENIQLWERQSFFIRTKRITCVPVSNQIAENKIKKIIDICNECDIRWFNIPINPWGADDKRKLFRFEYKI